MKNIVILCDGTSNQLETDVTNVFRMASSLINSKDQVAFYDPGVGTIVAAGTRGTIRKRLMLAYGLAFGVGFTRNLEEAYQFLMQKYEPEDKIFMFGFSRGAFTVRALAGMIHTCGLLDRDLENLIPYVSRAYTTKNDKAAERIRQLGKSPIPIHFLGIWDTVSSIGFAYRRMSRQFTANNPSVKIIRHAISIDERRAYFRQNKWGDKFKTQQDIKEVWFPGVHSNVGGGYPEDKDGLGKNALQWLAKEAIAKDLKVDESKLDVQADAGKPLNESLTGRWWILEFLPMNYTLRRRDFFFPLGKRRRVPADATIHQSVLDRMQIDERYRPRNLSIGEDLKNSTHPVEPWSVPPVQNSTPQPTTSAIREFFLALAWFSGFAYFSISMLVFIVPILGRIVEVLFLGTGWPPNWIEELIRSFSWPATALTWLRNGGQYFVLPMVAFSLGVFVISRLSGMWKVEKRVWGKLLHSRIQGYDTERVKRQCTYLRPDGVKAYLGLLKWDLLFPFVYGPLIWWGLEHTRGETFGRWITLLPLAGMIFDWIENTILINQISRFQKAQPLKKWAIQIASISTILKIATVVLSIAILLVLVIMFTAS